MGSCDAKRDAQMLVGFLAAAHAATWQQYEDAQSARLLILYGEAGGVDIPPYAKQSKQVKITTSISVRRALTIPCKGCECQHSPCPRATSRLCLETQALRCSSCHLVEERVRLLCGMMEVLECSRWRMY